MGNKQESVDGGGPDLARGVTVEDVRRFYRAHAPQKLRKAEEVHAYYIEGGGDGGGGAANAARTLRLGQPRGRTHHRGDHRPQNGR